MKTIQVSDTEFAMVDDEDYPVLSRFVWRILPLPGQIRVATRIRTKDNSANLYMHQLVLGGKGGAMVDHIDRNPLNNQKSNLRRCTHTENMRNRKLQRHSSRFKGVSRFRANGKWMSSIRVNKRKIHLGYFNDEESAARTYDAAAEKHFGQFAATNKTLGVLP